MRKRKPKRQEIGIEKASRLMHDLGLPTPEDIAVMSNLFDFALIEERGNRCGCCHQPIEPKKGIAFGKPGLLNGRIPPINVCANCVRLARIYLDSAEEGLI